ncbi:unnamed protein product [Meganyctiphanes norvegica]|uniref:Thyroglobulin type-1 domain-containing protein n=1 Tax=Meganyctiphanes norvegica TaxID=48144 RepID=A0AAV2PUN3_MEGNR
MRLLHKEHKDQKLVWILLAVIGPWMVTAQEKQDTILCSSDICDANYPYTENNRTICDHIPATRWPNPEKCNCGTQCVENLPLDHECQKKQNSFPDQLKVCGPGLMCTKISSRNNKCKPYSDKKCVVEYVKYVDDQDSGVLGPGRYQPVCDDLGDYAPRQCSTASSCYCVEKTGGKLFGEGALTEKDGMNCLCSQFWDDSAKLGREAGFRCLSNGNFDELQCIDKQYCFCYDPIKGDVTEGPWGFSMMPMLSCYNESLHGVNYTQPCLEDLEEYENNLENDDDDLTIIAVSNKPICGPDGYYTAVQYAGNKAYCSDSMGNRIEDFIVSLEDAVGMQCACARRRFLMEQGGLGSSKPKCHPQRGDFCRVQKRGLLAYCVDGSGNQLGNTVSIDDIPDLECAAVSGTMDC